MSTRIIHCEHNPKPRRTYRWVTASVIANGVSTFIPAALIGGEILPTRTGLMLLWLPITTTWVSMAALVRYARISERRLDRSVR